MSYSWKDYHGKHYGIQASVQEKDLFAAISSYGIEKQGLLMARQAEASNVARQYGVEIKVEEKTQNGRFGWSYRWRGKPGSLSDEQFHIVLNNRLTQAENKYLRNHAIQIEKEGQKKWIPDYALLAQRERPALADLIIKLNAATAGMDRMQKIQAVLSFVQSLRYEIPPKAINGRETLGLFTPTEVAVYKKGDCDSKSLFFATLWGKTNPDEIRLVVVPNHMLLAVRGLHATRKDQRTIKLGGIDYLLCESTKSGWFPGVIAEEVRRHIREGRMQVYSL